MLLVKLLATHWKGWKLQVTFHFLPKKSVKGWNKTYNCRKNTIGFDCRQLFKNNLCAPKRIKTLQENHTSGRTPPSVQNIRRFIYTRLLFLQSSTRKLVILQRTVRATHAFYSSALFRQICFKWIIPKIKPSMRGS